MSGQVRLKLLPSARCLFDQPIQVKVVGLRSRQVVTMRARSTDERGVQFTSMAIYRADGSGEIDLERDSSMGGSYGGVEPMGLLWSLSAEPRPKAFQKSSSLNPHVVKFSVHDLQDEDRMLAEATNERFLISDGVSRVPIQHGSFHGVLFTPPGEGPFPGVLDLCTFKSERRAALLAGKGFLVLSVTVYNGDPDEVKEMHLDPFKEAVDFLRQHPKVGSKGVGVIARSKGGDIALSLAAFVPGVQAVVWINGCNASVMVPLYYQKKKLLSALPFDERKVIYMESGPSITKYSIANPLAEEYKDTVVPIEKAKGTFLFVASEDDLNWDSKTFMEQAVERLKHHGKENFESICYPRAGHILETPYMPLRPISRHGISKHPVLWGGEAKVHVAAEIHLWKKIREYLRTQLTCDAPPVAAKL